VYDPKIHRRMPDTGTWMDRPLNGSIVVGVLSDTHGHLYPETMKALEGADHIIHAGDVGAPEILRVLQTLAPITAVRGNCDLGAWAEALPKTAELTIGGARIIVTHAAPRSTAQKETGRPLHDNEDVAVVVYGHSHLAAVDQRGRVLYLNPGSAGPRRFGRPRTVARLEILASEAKGSTSEFRSSPLVKAAILPLEE
jgi:putative phosphoesterase